MKLVPLCDLIELSDAGVWGEEDPTDGISVLRSTNFKADGTLDLSKLTFRALEERSRTVKLLRPGDILLEKSGGGPKQPVGRVCLFKGDERPHSFGNFIARLRPKSTVLSEYLFYYLRYFHSIGRTNHYQKQTTGIRNLEQRRYLTIKVPLVTNKEQRQAVDLLSRAEGIVRLQAEAQAKVSAIIPAIFNEMFGDPLSNPKGWKVYPLNEVSMVISGVAKGRRLDAVDVVELPYMRVANVKDGHLDLTEVKTIQIKRSEVAKLLIEPGDLLMTEGGDPDKLGRAALWEGQLAQCVHQNHIFKVRSDRSKLVPEYLRALAISSHGKGYFLRVAKQTTGIASINKTQLSAYPILLPPLEMQHLFAKNVTAVESIQKLQQAALESSKLTFNSMLSRIFSLGVYEDFSSDTDFSTERMAIA